MGFLPAGMGSSSKVGSGVFAECSSSWEHLHQLLCWICHGKCFDLSVHLDGTRQARCPQVMAHALRTRARRHLAPVPLVPGILVAWERLAYGELPGTRAYTSACQLSSAKRITAPLSDVSMLAIGKQLHKQQEWPGAPRSCPCNFLIVGGCLQEQSQGMTQTSHSCSVSEAAENR